MAVVAQKLVIEADPNRPKDEIISIIAAYLQIWPGSETVILKAVQKEIETIIQKYEKKGGNEHNENHVSGHAQQSNNRIGSSDHSNTDDDHST
ncbi:hypothetical protein ACFSTH_08415 [Paenibacillus yanchengensis]|uniref:Uncharacterized protein n=1 Tax=Paenibacillus yanchengensis TaxID=2035833 RepID=A0ABW4YKZ5_9BACL